MIINNTVSAVGDILVITTETPILGLLILSSFIDSTEGETSNKYFNKIFRYSVDGINYSDWLLLTNANLLGIEIEPTNAFMIQYQYQRVGTDLTGLLQFNEVTIQGEFEELPTPDIYSRSIFAQFFTYYNICSLNWSLNVLAKIYNKGLIPKYITR